MAAQEFEMDNKAVITAGNKIGPAKYNGPVHCIYDEFTLTEELEVGDTFVMPPVPESALIIDAQVFIDGDCGTGGILDLGNQAYTDYEGNSVAANSDSYVDQVDAGGQAAFKRATLESVGLWKQVGKGGMTPELIATEASSTGTGKTVYAAIYYLLP